MFNFLFPTSFVKKLILRLCEILVKRTDNDLDDEIFEMIKKLLIEEKIIEDKK